MVPSGQLVSALALKVLPALAAASVPRDYSTVAVTLVKVLSRMTHGSAFCLMTPGGEKVHEQLRERLCN